MPIYEYHCGACQSEVSVLYLTFSEVVPESEARCPDCGSVGLRRLASRFGFSAKGPAAPGTGVLRQTPVSQGQAEEDPRQLARAMRAADAGGDQDFKEVSARLEKGESATSVEESLRARVGETMGAH